MPGKSNVEQATQIKKRTTRKQKCSTPIKKSNKGRVLANKKTQLEKFVEVEDSNPPSPTYDPVTPDYIPRMPTYDVLDYPGAQKTKKFHWF